MQPSTASDIMLITKQQSTSPLLCFYYSQARGTVKLVFKIKH